MTRAESPWPHFLLGVNYWSRAGGPRMWEGDRFDPDRIEAELRQMADMGLNCCRSFTFIPTFAVRGGENDQGALARFEAFLELCARAGVSTLPSFLVGHMSGENYDFPEQRNRSPYTDEEVLSWQESLIREVGTACAHHRAVAGYIASNEMPYWAGRARVARVFTWAKRIRDALRSVDSARPFGLGDGVMNLGGGQNGFDVETLSPLVDFLGPHTYYSDSDAARQALNCEYCVRSLTHTRRPILFEEFGASSNQASEDNQAIYYREVLHSVLSTGCAGALSWCFSDFDIEGEAPYEHHAFELGFGVTRADGSEKPVCDELRAVRSLVDYLGGPVVVARPTAAILVPSYFNTTYPFSREDRARMRRVLLQCYVLCVKAGVEAELVPETGPLEDYTLIMAPATQKLLASTWSRLERCVVAGATLYWSFFGGDYRFHQGVWCQRFEELTGARHHLRYGCADLPPPVLRIETDEVRVSLDTHAGGADVFPRSFLPVEPAGAAPAHVLATAEGGWPALTRARRGAGEVIFCPFPLEYYLAQLPAINEVDTSESLYSVIARSAGVRSPVRPDPSLIQARLAVSIDRHLLWLINRSWREATTTIDTPGAKPIYGQAPLLRAGPSEVTLGRKEVLVYELDEPI